MMGFVIAATACGRTEVSTRDAAAATAADATKPRQVRTVYVTRMVTTWYEDGTSSTVPAPDVASIAVDAIAPDGQGGTTTIAGVQDGGTWTLSSVPVGRYTLRVVGARYTPLLFLQVAGNHIDLGYDRAMRHGIHLATSSTVATFELSGLAPWASPDFIQLFAWAPALYQEATSYLETGATSGEAIEDFGNGSMGQQFNPLLIPSDRLYLAHFQAVTGAGNQQYWRPVAAGSVTGLDMVDGTPLTIPLALAPVPQDRSATIDWRTTEFESHLAEAGSGARAAGTPHVFGVYGEPLPPGLSTGSSTPDSLLMYPPVGADVNLGTVTYGSYVPPPFNERAAAQFRIRVNRALPGATRTGFIVPIGRTDAAVPSPIVPVLTPVRSVTIEGLDALQPQTGVGLAPLITWGMPSVGAPEFYEVTVYALGATDGRTTSQHVVTLLAEDPGARVPADILVSGTSYVFTVTAFSGMEGPASPFRFAVPRANAGFVSEVFTP